MLRQLEEVGAVICAAGSGLAPADKKLYALRDVTGTVESIPLIASSIMSKKIAEGTGALVLDVKVGSGAFMKSAESARELARTLVDLGQAAGVRTVALVTDMSTPLGLTAGNALEVRESVEVLAGGGPADVVELTVALAREMVAAAGRDDRDPADLLASGAAMDVWRAMIRAQHGDPDAELPLGPGARGDHRGRGRGAGAAGRAGRRDRGLAARGRPGPQGGCGPGRGRRTAAREARRPGARPATPLFTLHTDTPERFAAREPGIPGRSAHRPRRGSSRIGDARTEKPAIDLGRVNGSTPEGVALQVHLIQESEIRDVLPAPQVPTGRQQRSDASVPAATI